MAATGAAAMATPLDTLMTTPLFLISSASAACATQHKRPFQHGSAAQRFPPGMAEMSAQHMQVCLVWLPASILLVQLYKL